MSVVKVDAAKAVQGETLSANKTPNKLLVMIVGNLA